MSMVVAIALFVVAVIIGWRIWRDLDDLDR